MKMVQDAALFTDTLLTHLRFMNDAAHLMAVIAPACSSHIMSQQDTIMFATEMAPTEAHRRQVCGGCGIIKIPAWTVAVAKEDSNGRREHKMTKRQQQKLKERAARTHAAMVDICKRCDRKTRQSILNPAPQRITRNQAPVSRPLLTNAGVIPSTAVILTPTATLPVPSAEAAKKKRSKSKKQGGLQALLAKSKEAQSSKGFGLDLMDLMK